MTEPRTARGRAAPLALTVNGHPVEVLAPPQATLIEVLRENLGLTGTKHGCELGECGACTVLVDGRPRLSCLTLAVACAGAEVFTVEGLARGPALHPLQQAFVELGAAQCGFCTPGMLMVATAFLARNRDPAREQIRHALAGNLCRCTGYLKIFEAIELAGQRLRAAAQPDEAEDSAAAVQIQATAASGAEPLALAPAGGAHA
jgi:aerobic-type carbon monoxide dehydrogenase small subunit (CoxS/CutS family)